MEDLDLMRRSRRAVDMLKANMRHGHQNKELLAEIELHMEHGIGTEPRCEALRTAVDHLRESTLTPRPELCMDTIRCSEKLKDAIEDVVSRLG